jgi:hypothetical protein
MVNVVAWLSWWLGPSRAFACPGRRDKSPCPLTLSPLHSHRHPPHKLQFTQHKAHLFLPTTASTSDEALQLFVVAASPASEYTRTVQHVLRTTFAQAQDYQLCRQ